MMLVDNGADAKLRNNAALTPLHTALHGGRQQVARDLLGTNVACWGAHYICKLPGEDDLSPVGLHPDGSPACHQDVRAAELSLQCSPEV